MKENFKDILKVLEPPDFASGVFLFKRYLQEKWTWQKTIMRISFIMYPMVSLTFMYGTIRSKVYPDLLAWIFVTSRAAIEITVYCMIYCSSNKEILEIYRWCEKLYDTKETFHPKIIRIAEKKVLWMHNFTFKLLKSHVKIFMTTVGFMTVGITLIGFCLPDSVYPRFTLPLPYFLPFFKEQNSWMAFWTTFLVQSVYSFSSGAQTVGVLGIIYFIACYIMVYMEIIYEAVILMKSDLEFLMKDEKKREIREKMQNWVPLLVKMICEVREMFEKYNDVFSPCFLMMEFCCYGGVFQFGLLVIVVKQQITYGLCVTMLITLVFLVLSFISVIILERFQKIVDELYDVPWYALEPPERKLLYQMMLCGRFKMSLKLAGSHRLGLEKFSEVMKAAYVNCLVLKKLVTA